MMNTALIDQMVSQAVKQDAEDGRRAWSEAEEQFVSENLGWLTDDEMGAYLGRTGVAVHLHWKREMHLPAPSRAPDVIVSDKAAAMLGLDGHKLTHWVDAGLIPGRLMAGGKKIRLIQRETLRRWVLNPMNWVYFDWRGIRDPELRRMCSKRAKRWGDEWWTTRQVADYHGVGTGDVKRYIHLGRIRSYRLPFSLGGRHSDRVWSYHFVLKSEATRKDLRFVHRGEDRSTITPRGKAWLKKALKLGLNATAIARTMKRDHMTILNWIERYFPSPKNASSKK